jgi:anhydro-N-acetylmuramic acid kinase
MSVVDKYSVIGLMSGTSLDGLDIVHSIFRIKNGEWCFEIVQAETLEYSEKWKVKLTEAFHFDANSLKVLDLDFGNYLGNKVKQFIDKFNIHPDLIASHGHTIHHQPEKKYTLQIGSGQEIFNKVGIPVAFNFRQADVLMGGQGAPLVPIGDEMLFGAYDFCLNLGGFANISYAENGNRIAYDLTVANLALNLLAKRNGFEYDIDGEIASKGVIDDDLLIEMNKLSYFSLKPPKSLGREWAENEFFPLLEKKIPIENLMATCVEHIALQIINSTSTKSKGSSILATGGGAFNKFLISRLGKCSDLKVVVPKESLVSFKEALIFAFLGVRLIRNESNCLASVTGAPQDHVSGELIN